MAGITTGNWATVDNLSLSDTLGIQFSAKTSAPTDSDLAAGRIYYDSTAAALRVYNGATWASLGAGGGGVPSWETIWAADHSMDLTTGGWTISESGAFDLLTLTKSNASTGTVLALNNAGTGVDIYVTKSEAGATGVVFQTLHSTASPANSDVPFSLLASGKSSTGATREYANMKVVAASVTNGAEYANLTFNVMTNGTSRKIIDASAALLLVGYGAAATISSQGAYDLVLKPILLLIPRQSQLPTRPTVTSLWP